uniref:Uncharacterized protein n=1 Tax=Populus alba TaxID=43335 RepID=A0A4U5R3A7_POPAL|nr:hypothetical protein D5086_0000022350 [Populus alba]
MAKNKGNATSIVARRQDVVHAPIAVPDDHDPDGDGFVVLALKVDHDEAWVRDCFVDFDDAILEEDRLDFNFSDEKCVDSPKSPTLPPTKNVSSPLPLEVECLTLPL